jgi:isopenicillin-N epimerase
VSDRTYGMDEATQREHAARAGRWTLDPAVVFLNHGSFGACPRDVLEHQRRLQTEMERQPLQFLSRSFESKIDAARERVARFVGARPEDVVFVRNATEGVNAVLRSLALGPDDELLTTDHAYNACKNALQFVAERAGARVVVAKVPFPIEDASVVTERVLAAVTRRTRLALIDHVTSPTGLVFPVEDVVRALRERGVEALVDGAHAPGMLPLALEDLGAAYYTGNAHKWLCAPKGAALLYARRDVQRTLRPAVISHGANDPRAERGLRSRFWLEFDWCGTFDPTAVLSVPYAIEWMESLTDGGLAAVRAHNHALVLRARQILCERLAVEAPAPASMLGSLATVCLPPSPVEPWPSGALPFDPLHERLWEEFRIEVPVFSFGPDRRRCVRVAAQWYNYEAQYHQLAEALATLLERGA